MNHTFEYFPIETAPKDGTDVIVFADGFWQKAAWLVVNSIGGKHYGWRNWHGHQVAPTYWAKIAAMKPGDASQ